MRLSTLGHAISLAAIWCIPEALAVKANAAAAQANHGASALLASLPVTTVSGPIAGVPTDLAAARAAILAGKYTPKAQDQTRVRCPALCSHTGLNSSDWFTYHDVPRLQGCNKTMLLDFSLFNPISKSKSHVSISACTADLDPATSGSSGSKGEAATCGLDNAHRVTTKSPVQLASSGSSSSAGVEDVLAALDQLRAHSKSSTSCNETIKYAYSGHAAVGVYVGAGLAGQDMLASLLEKLSAQIQGDGSVPETMLAQMCSSNSSARYTLGVYTNSKGQLGPVQQGLGSWKNSTCITKMDKTNSAWDEVTYLAPSLLHGNTTTASNSTHEANKSLTSRADCRTVQVVSGDSCASLASECGVSAADFTTYNPASDFCAKLAPGQHVCCSSGTLPNFSPTPDSKGNCYSYLVKTGDSCSSLAAAYDIASNDVLETYNKNTWGWNGCQNLFADYTICLSSGYPPMPAPVANANCGPQVPGTVTVPPGTDLNKINECPLNACCNIFGQCGTTAEFCTISNSTTGAPGTAAAGQNGCISNCGTNIISSGTPSETINIAYFEAFDWQRPCLHMSVSDIDTTAYSHIHFSFVTLNSDYSINTTDVASQLPLLQGMVGVKRVVSVGGWAFSTDPGTYTIFRTAVASEANRQTLVGNLVKFMNDYNLDGIDWDWEYPDEPDIPGIPQGTPAESTGFFLLMEELKQKVPAGKTVSITAPASYWYLQHFPIQALSLVVDYVVLMTYDLHGQWDYTDKYGSPGCGSFDQGLGNCLRSHINITETVNALSMITKAGVPSSMIAVGVSSYGRSFQMTTPGCWTEQCTYTGPASGAYPGRCTNTAGYISDFEIGEIVSQNPSAKKYFDESSQSNIVVFNDTQWVAYMDDSNKATRKALYPGIGFLGTADWAVDLQSNDGSSGSGSSGSGGGIIYIDPGIWNSVTPLVVAPPGATLIWPPMPLSSATTISFPPWITTIVYSSLTTVTSTLPGGETTTQRSYIDVSWLTTLTIPPVTTTDIPVWGVTLDSGSTTGTILLTSSVQPPPFTVTVTPVMSGTTSIIGATETTTSSGGVVIWGSRTYTRPDETETFGGHTTVIGGKTLPPTIITVTPNPHPTTTNTKPDPIINPKTPKWTSGGGSDIKPTALPGCPGCGLPCLLWCDPNCPTCPPGAFPPENGDGDDGDDDDDSSTSTDSHPMTAYTVIADNMGDDSFPTGFAALADLSSLSSEELAMLQSMFGPTSTPTSTKPTTTDTPPTPKPTPRADCDFWDEGWGWTFEVYNIQDWSADGGSSLHHEENGCGALTGWDWSDSTSTTFAMTYFNLPFFIKDGCVERAIVSAGGPKISCTGHGLFGKKRNQVGSRDSSDDDHRVKVEAVPPSFSDAQIQQFKSFYAVNDTYQSYSPLSWATASPTTTKPASL